MWISILYGILNFYFNHGPKDYTARENTPRTFYSSCNRIQTSYSGLRDIHSQGMKSFSFSSSTIPPLLVLHSCVCSKIMVYKWFPGFNLILFMAFSFNLSSVSFLLKASKQDKTKPNQPANQMMTVRITATTNKYPAFSEINTQTFSETLEEL